MNGRTGYNQPQPVDFSSTTVPGATSVWVGSRPISDQKRRLSTPTYTNQSSNPEHINTTQQRQQSFRNRNHSTPAFSNQGQLYVVSVKESPPVEPNPSRIVYSSNNNSLSLADYPTAGVSGIQNGTGPLPLTSYPSTFVNPGIPVQSHLQYTPQTVTNMNNLSSMYPSMGYLPPLSGSTMGNFPQLSQPLQPSLATQAYANQQQCMPSVDLLTAALGQQFSLQQPTLPLTYSYGQPWDTTLTAATSTGNNLALFPVSLQNSLPQQYSSSLLNPSLTLSTPTLPSTLYGGSSFLQNPVSTTSTPVFLNAYQTQLSQLKADDSLSGSSGTGTGFYTTTVDHADDQATSGIGSSIPSSPSDSSPTSPNSVYHEAHSFSQQEELAAQAPSVAPCYERPADEQSCLRCGKKVRV